MNIRNFLVRVSIVIVLTPNGFEPSRVEIPKGTTITFETTRDRYFWPASNEHPSHTAYKEFDPQKPVGPGESWSFRFDREGSWRFHDHVSPYFTGVIEVTGSGTREEKAEKKSYVSYIKTFIMRHFVPLNYSACRDPALDRNSRITCWENIVVTLVQRRGLGRALSFVEKEKNTNTAFAADCHVYVHRIGEEYYWRFYNNRDIEVSDLFGLCDEGFFHGFMQEFASHEGSLIQSKRFCGILASTQLTQQCYHGIGHGASFLFAGQYWGDTDKIIALAIQGCEEIVPDNPRMCISGVFGGMAAMYWGLHGYTLEFDKSNPFALCKNQSGFNTIDCFDQLVPVAFGEIGFMETGAMIGRLDAAMNPEFLMEHLGSMPSYTLVPKTDDFSSVVENCRTFRKDLVSHCLRGFALSLQRIGSKDAGVARFRRFCESEILTPEEKRICYEI